MLPKTSLARWATRGLVLVPVLALAACGSSKSTKPTKAAITVSPAGKSTKYTTPKSIKGGLVELTVTNQAKDQQTVQLVRVEGNHTIAEAAKVVASSSDKTPSWVRGQGGVTALPGQSATGTLNLPAGRYLVTGLGGPGSAAPPGTAEMTVTKGDNGDLPKAPTTIDAASTGKDKYEWKISGDALKAGANTVEFKAGGKDAIHFIGAFRVTGNVSDAEIAKALRNQNGPPPKFIDQSSFYSTAVLDGGLSQTTPLVLNKPGRWVLFCPLTDRDGGKSHDQEGLLKTVEVK